jgi:hypothetical protein
VISGQWQGQRDWEISIVRFTSNFLAAGVPAQALKEITGWDRNPDKAHKSQEATE